ncbi:major facilitator superfamily domain-containing protein [Microdochium trichocladiopsis]|uniref:Major facilitator superfamily domain-containing protein n=1 Tax=Microdochium trichocladiopsis TaxID=1682393 RepID=A0A9P9BJI5_9PEZI|nr:major facilitator superfamily domain-containing protein [Microdochium trichocladiopsis]KAH7014656.1 major facilitator superfamily domain-containing protein [Microdochium trichocladiopsis]
MSEKNQPDNTSGTEVSTDRVPPDAARHVEGDAAAEQRLVRKNDLLMMPGLALAYFTHTLDRANLGNAKTDGIEKDLGMVGNQFSLLLVLFYVPYALFNIPWYILAKKYNSAVIIPIAILGWGACTMGAAAATSFSGIMATRIVMGALEAAYKPCEVYYLSLFYTRREMGLRMGFIAGAASGLISWSVFKWENHLHGWQWLFLIEGAITVAVAIYLYIFAPRSPDKSRWYTDDERALARARLEQDSQDQDKHFRWADAKRQLQHWPTCGFAFLALMYGVGVASSSNFLPSIIKRLTNDTTTANLYTVGPNLVASVFQLTIVWLSDRYQQRASIACATTVLSLVAWILLGTLDLSRNPQVGYFLAYIITSATFIPSNIVPVWLSSNVPTTTGRAVALGLSYMGMNLAGIVSSLTFRAEDAPVYRPALTTVGCTQGVFILGALYLRWYYARLNKRLDSGDLAHAQGMEARPAYRYAV